MQHVMIDLETFGTRSNSVIVTIGAVQFDPHSNRIGDVFHYAIDPKSAMLHGMKMDASTIFWWLEQAEAARSALVAKAKAASSLGSTLGAFRSYLHGIEQACGAVFVWGNGADFDLALLQQAYESVGQEKPWKYNASRCFRTLRSEFGVDTDYVKPTVAHDALADAVAQAHTAQNIFARLKVSQ